MATPLENVTTAHANFAAKLAEVSVNPKRTYSIDGLSVSHVEYMDFLTKGVKSTLELMTLLQPYEIRSRVRPV